MGAENPPILLSADQLVTMEVLEKLWLALPSQGHRGSAARSVGETVRCPKGKSVPPFQKLIRDFPWPS